MTDMLLPKTERLRSPRHLAWIRTLPCTIHDCGRQPVDPHHLTHVQPKGRGLRSSDALAVPLCRWGHHSATSPIGVHHFGDEAAWWLGWAIDPVAIAARLWSESNQKRGA
jgi:hypothetical protein